MFSTKAVLDRWIVLESGTTVSTMLVVSALRIAGDISARKSTFSITDKSLAMPSVLTTKHQGYRCSGRKNASLECKTISCNP